MTNKFRIPTESGGRPDLMPSLRPSRLRRDERPLRPCWVLVALLFFPAIGLLSYCAMGTKLATTPGQIITDTLDADNVVRNYEWFHDVNASYRAKLGQIATHKTILAETTDQKETARLRIELAAMQQTCRELVTRYNANATKTNRSIFMGREAPPSLEIETCE